MTSIALITGASRGIGAATALLAARQGWDIAVNYSANEGAAREVVQAVQALGRRAIAVQADVADPAAVARLFDQALQAFGSVDVLVNNAGVMPSQLPTLANTDDTTFDQLLAINLKGSFNTLREAARRMADGGRIVNLSSGLTRFALPNYSAYASMKGAVEVLTHYMAKELGPRGIAVNTVAPGAIATDFGGGHVRDDAQINSFVAGQTALGRVGLPDDIGGVVAALLSPANGWVNAQRIEASGGMFL